MKKFLELTPRKLFVAALLFAIFSAVSPALYSYIVLDAKLIGLPLPFAFKGSAEDFFWLQLLFDLLFWYVAAAFLFYLGRITKK